MSTLTAIPTASKRLTAELWISFASLLRSHVAMRTLVAPAAGLRMVAVSDGEMRIEARGRALRMLAPGASGAGVLEFGASNQPKWFLFAEDGRILLDGSGEEDMEMEVAVESLLDRVTA